VVLFVPAESLFSAALEGDHDLIMLGGGEADFAGDAGVAHRAVAFGERELAAARADGERAENRRSRAGTLRTVCKFTEHFERIRDGLEKFNNAFNDAVGSYERMVRPAGRKDSKSLAARLQAKNWRMSNHLTQPCVCRR